MSNVADTLERLKKLDEERGRLLDGMKGGLIAAIRENLASLRELGFNYELVAAGAASSSPRRERKAGGRICSICHKPGHNSRTCPTKAA